MTCERHAWWFDVQCPECAAESAPVTAPVTESAPGEDAEPDGVPPIPRYLLRNPDNTLLDPTPFPKTDAITRPLQIAPRLAAAADMSDTQLRAAVSSEALSVDERQPYIHEMRRREDKIKARERIAKMKENLDAKKPDEL